MNILENKKARYQTLGCKLNFAETNSLRDKMLQQGVALAGEGEVADICIVNTCSVTDMADHKCRQTIHRMLRENPGCLMVVLGCYAQLQPEAIASFEGVDLVIGMEHKGHTIEYIGRALARKQQQPGHACHESIAVASKDIRTFVPSCSHGDRTRYFLKVQDGCNYYCSYCTIPIARGRSRSGTVAEMVAQAEQVAAQGGKEIVITGVNIGDFGRTTNESFLDLVKALDGVEGIQRFRISSLEPDLLSDELIDYCAASRAFMPHFHIPLQSGSDAVLKLMHRRYDTALFAHKIQRIKERMPDAFIGVDVMVGTRGEEPAFFEETYEFLRSLDVTQLHVFPYSERPGTAALKIPYVVSEADKRQRSHRLLELSDEKTHAFYEKHIGQTAEVLFEKAVRGKAMHGFTRNYVRVELPPAEADEAYDNQLLQVRLGDFNRGGDALRAVII